ncbi:expressed conserved protein [Echinococcus multilocularis]|uniref:Expressed conserved protein n=1 Tax=Echinococcus multilocularis TaxID=6211 RepID=A0A068Y889_ECHMU|nr:expressed conserved protein [Echinococcus multilocularis]
MSRARPRSLNLRTPLEDAYGNSMRCTRIPRASSRSRLCSSCANGLYTTTPSKLLPSPAFLPVQYMIPMVYAPAAAPIAAPLPIPPVVYKEPFQHSDTPYPIDESDETDCGEMEDMRTTTEETFSTLQRNTLRRNDYMATNLIRDFEETNWIPIDDNSRDVQDWTIRRNQWFQRSVELPTGVITKLHCEKLPPETSSYSTLRKSNMQRLRITGRVRHWSPTLRAITEEDFSEEMLLPQGTDFSTISYKLQTKNIQQYNESQFTKVLRHQSTSYEEDTGKQPFTENTVVITGRVDRIPKQEVAPVTQMWSKEYKYTVRGTIDLSPEGRIMNPVITSYSEMPDALVNLAPMTDQDTSCTVVDGKWQIRIRLDDKVDRNSIELEANPSEETVKLVFARHSQNDANGVTVDDDQPKTATTTTVFALPATKFDITGITKRIQGQDLLLSIPMHKSVVVLLDSASLLLALFFDLDHRNRLFESLGDSSPRTHKSYTLQLTSIRS